MPAERGVLDANLLATALVSPHGPGNALLHSARLERFQLVVSQRLLDEVRRVLEGAFHLVPADADALISLVKRIGEVHEPVNVSPRTRDPDDDHVLALAGECGAVFLATYDHDLMAVHSVDRCGVVDPRTALELVYNLNVEALDEGIPGVALGDHSRWHHTEKGPPYETVLQLIAWLRTLPRRRHEGRELFTVDGWTIFQASLATGEVGRLLPHTRYVLDRVSYPAEGMAYVLCRSGPHPDEAGEKVDTLVPSVVEAMAVTLLQCEGRWLVHQVGGLALPEDVGLTPY